MQNNPTIRVRKSHGCTAVLRDSDPRKLFIFWPWKAAKTSIRANGIGPANGDRPFLILGVHHGDIDDDNIVPTRRIDNPANSRTTYKDDDWDIDLLLIGLVLFSAMFERVEIKKRCLKFLTDFVIWNGGEEMRSCYYIDVRIIFPSSARLEFSTVGEPWSLGSKEILNWKGKLKKNYYLDRVTFLIFFFL